MLSLKNPFAKTPPDTSSISSAPVTEASVKGKQLLRVRTKARVESLREEVNAAHAAVKQAERTVGERRADDLDITAATEELRQAGDRFRALQVALTFAIQKDEDALAALKDATSLAEIEKEFEALTNLKLIMGPEGEDLLNRIEKFANKLAAAINNAHEAGAGGSYNPLHRVPQEFLLFMCRAMHVVTGQGYMANGLMRYKKWSDSLPDPETARTRPRP